MKAKAYAKINLALDVLGKRDDGYHNISSVFQSVSLCDIVSVIMNNSGKVTVTASNIALSGIKNSAYAAAMLYKEKTDFGGADIYIEKHIPTESGMGGGSADAAAVLVVLNRLCNNPLSKTELLDLALNIGADVPFCINGGTALVEGIGEKITPLKPLLGCSFVLAKNANKPSTAELYKRLDNSRRKTEVNVSSVIGSLDNIEKLSKLCSNAFEDAWQNSKIDKLKQMLTANGALCAVMSGSGPTVFSLFEEKTKAENCIKTVINSCTECFIVEPENAGVQIIE